MATNAGIPWKDLDTKGFVHVPGFLSADELDACRADYSSRPPGSNRNYDAPRAGAALERLRAPMQAALASIAEHTSIRVDCFVDAAYFATRRGVKFNWHQEHESYFVFQSHTSFLNFYIPVFKPRPDKSNLCVVPFDVLERESPETFRRALWSGATTVRALSGGQFLEHDDTGRAEAVAVSFDDIASTPQLSAGDVLIVRGDVFHRTEDNDTDRVALSIRLASNSIIVSRSRMADGGLSKARMFLRNMGDYEMMFRAFELAGKNELSWGEMKPLIGQARERFAPSPSPKVFLLKQKIRAGVLFGSAIKAARELTVNRLKRRYWTRRMKALNKPGQRSTERAAVQS